jgi:cobalt/nickel transport system permease protein
MHIIEGVLTPPVIIIGAAIAAAGTAVGLKKMDYDKIPKVAVLSSAFFVASLIHIPLGPVSAHLLLIGLMGILLCWTCFPAILIGLLLQTLLFQYGGLTVLGVNTMSMGLPALIVYFLFHRLIKSGSRPVSLLFSFLAGFLAVLLSTALTAFSLVFSGQEFTNIARIIFVGHLPLMAVEGAVIAVVVNLVKKIKPEMLEVPYALSQNA